MEDGEQHWPFLEEVLSFQFVEGLLKRNKNIMGTGSKVFLFLHPTIHLLLPLNARAVCIQASDSGISTSESSFYNH